MCMLRCLHRLKADEAARFSRVGHKVVAIKLAAKEVVLVALHSSQRIWGKPQAYSEGM